MESNYEFLSEADMEALGWSENLVVALNDYNSMAVCGKWLYLS